MWLLSFIPDAVIALFVHAITIAGLVLLVGGTVLSRFLGPIAQFSKPIGLLLLLGGIYFEGGLQNEMHWRAEVEKQNAEIARLNAAAQEVTTVVETKYIERIKTVKGKTDVIIKKVQEYITKNDDAGCTIPDNFRLLYNAAAKNELPETTGEFDGTASSSAERAGTK